MRIVALTLLAMIAGFSSGAYAANSPGEQRFIDYCLGMAGVGYQVTCQAKTDNDGALLGQIGLGSQFQVDLAHARTEMVGTDRYENVTVPVAGRFFNKKNLKLNCGSDFYGVWKLGGFTVEIENRYDGMVEAAVDCR